MPLEISLLSRAGLEVVSFEDYGSGGEPRVKLTDAVKLIEGVSFSKWSPDGKLLATFNDTSNIAHVYNPDDSWHQQSIVCPEKVRNLGWSLTGRFVAIHTLHKPPADNLVIADAASGQVVLSCTSKVFSINFGPHDETLIRLIPDAVLIWDTRNQSETTLRQADAMKIDLPRVETISVCPKYVKEALRFIAYINGEVGKASKFIVCDVRLSPVRDKSPRGNQSKGELAKSDSAKCEVDNDGEKMAQNGKEHPSAAKGVDGSGKGKKRFDGRVGSTIELSAGRCEVVGSYDMFTNYHEIDYSWNATGDETLIKLSGDVDYQGRSYYGNSFLILLSHRRKEKRIVVDHTSGPIYSFLWLTHPLNKSGQAVDQYAGIDRRNLVLIIYGRSQNSTRLYDANAGQEVLSYGDEKRNFLTLSQDGRHLLCGGFGNLPGYFDIWNLDEQDGRLVGSGCANWSIGIEFSPDSNYILSSVTSPRLRVDNGFKIFDVLGNLLFSREINELYKAEWRPSTGCASAVREAQSAETSTTIESPTRSPRKKTTIFDLTNTSQRPKLLRPIRLKAPKEIPRIPGAPLSAMASKPPETKKREKKKKKVATQIEFEIEEP